MVDEEVLGCEKGAADGRMWTRCYSLLLVVDDDRLPGWPDESLEVAVGKWGAR